MPVPDVFKFAANIPGSFLQVDSEGRLVLSPVAISVSGGSVTIANDNIDATREIAYTTLTVANAANVSTTFDMSKFSSGVLLVPSGFAGYIHFEDSEDGVTFAPILDEFGGAIVITQFATPSVTALRYALPSKLFGCGIVRLATYTNNTRASVQNQTGAQTLRVRLKS